MVFAFSADPTKPGIVGICAQVKIVDFVPGSTRPIAVRKPVIYAYPQRRTRVRVAVEIDGAFTAVYPALRDGAWTVMAEPSGELVDEATGRRHRYLFWEGISDAFAAVDPARAHLVAGAEAAGAVIRGETSHYDYVCLSVTQGITELMLKTQKPISFGILTTENEEQALDRVGGRQWPQRS